MIEAQLKQVDDLTVQTTLLALVKLGTLYDFKTATKQVLRASGPTSYGCDKSYTLVLPAEGYSLSAIMFGQAGAQL